MKLCARSKPLFPFLFSNRYGYERTFESNFNPIYIHKDTWNPSQTRGTHLTQGCTTCRSVQRRVSGNLTLKSVHEAHSHTTGFTLPKNISAYRAILEASTAAPNIPSPVICIADVEEQPLCEVASLKPKSPIPTEGELITAI